MILDDVEIANRDEIPQGLGRTRSGIQCRERI